MADMKRIKGRIAETIYPNGTGAITAESHQALLLEMVDDINAKKADKEEVVTVAESVSMLSQEVESNRINFTESLDALEQKVNNLPQGGGDVKADGVYPDLIAGDLAGRGESVPAEFTFRASGGKSIKDGRAYIKRIKGNSVVWNQMYPTDWSLNAMGFSLVSSNNVISVSGTATGTYIRLLPFDNNEVNNIYIFELSGTSSALNGKTFSLANRSGGYADIVNGYASFIYYNTEQEQQKERYVTIDNISTGDVVNEQNLVIRQINLTKMFGEGCEPSTIEEYNSRKPIVEDEYAYNEGQVIHCNTESIKSVGDNAWDEQWERGDINLTTGEKYDSDDYVRTKNPIKVIPNETYVIDAISSGRILFYDNMNAYIGKSDAFGNTTKITMPNNCHYIMYRWEGTTYNHDIMIRLDHSGWKSNTGVGYEPYWQDTLPLPIIRKYFPDGMKKWDKIIKKDGKWYAVNAATTARIGDLTCSRFSEGIFSLGNLPKIAAVDSRGFSENVISANFIPSLGAYGNLMETNSVCIVDDLLWLSGDNLVQYETAEDLLTSLADVVVYYKLAEPIVTEITDTFRDYYQVADFGTEMSQSNVPSAPFSADIIYQFNAVDMIREHEEEITELQKVIATMQAQLTSLINGGQ